MKRALVRLVTVAALLATGLIAPGVGNSPTGTAEAANLAHFDPGNIVSDAVFYDYLSMNASDIQAFLTAKGANCTAGSLCLKNYSVATTDRAADNLCSGYQGAGVEKAATIISRVAVACRVSPRVLLVLLQKEMGLVTATSPTARKYERAAGYACPDSANGGCDPAYAGLQNQLYWSAWQYRKYQASPDRYSHVAGRNNNILWHPDAPRCGASTVFIVNQATAGLYNYTPYRPDQAALNAGYGEGGDCSSYGNRNFWNYFTDWFGSTQSTGGGAIYNLHAALGGDGGSLGPASAPFHCGLINGGCFQHFERGSIYWSPATGAHAVTGVIRDSWAARGWERHALGYPTTSTFCGLVGGGCFQHFQGGSLYWTQATGARFIRNHIRDAWEAAGWEAGWLGYPLTDEVCGLRGGGCTNHFEHGTIYWSPATGAHPTNPQILSKWVPLGMENGTLGYPATDVACGSDRGGCFQGFQGGTVYWTQATGAQFVRGSIQAAWGATGWQSGWLGYPLTDEVCGLRGGGCTNHFEHGTIYWTLATGAHPTNTQILSKWVPLGMENGTLGYPATDVVCGSDRGGCFQGFQGGTVYWTQATGAQFVRGSIQAAWGATGWQSGWLGYPTTDEVCGLRDNGCFSHFENGSIYWSLASGAHAVSGAIADAWAAGGLEQGPWGYPVEDAETSGTMITQRFQGGTAIWDTTTGSVTI